MTATVALVTGASRGLGAAIALALADAGHAVAVNYRSDEQGAADVRRTIVAAGGTAELFRADVTDEAEVEALHAAALAAFGRVDVLVLNATGPQPSIAPEQLTWQDVVDQLAYFVKSPLLLTQHVVEGMKQRGYGRIVNVGSEVVDLGNPGSSAYVAAKSAQLGLTRSWARRFGPHGITVNLVAPGWIPTERHAGVDQAEKDAYAEFVPLGHLGVPDDVAAAVTFLASDAAGFITGQRLAVNGGRTLT